MTDTTIQTTSITPEIIRSKLQIALTKAEQSIQLLHTAETTLVYNEDNLAEVSKFIENCKKAEKTVEEERVKLKEPYLQGGRTVDDGAKLISTELVTLRQKAHVQYTKLCQEVERKKREAEKEKLRIENIRKQMDEFKMTYSLKIANALTSSELVDIERRINLETANKTKYSEYLPEFIEGCKAIRSLLTTQKQKVRELEDLEKQALQASANNDDGAFMEIQDKKESLEAKIAENRVTVQEVAVGQSTNATPVSADIILPEIPKGGRKLWRYEVVDLKAAQKAGLTLTVIDEAQVKLILAKKRDLETEVTENGIRYFIEKKW